MTFSGSFCRLHLPQILASDTESRAENVRKLRKSRAENVKNRHKSRAENVIFLFHPIDFH